jgi:exoribonuclease II
MPLYEFQNNETGDIIEVFLKMNEKAQYLVDNPHLTAIITSAPATCDSVIIGVRKIDSGFKDVLQKIHQRSPGSKLNTNTTGL